MHNARPIGVAEFSKVNANFGYQRGRSRGRGRNNNSERGDNPRRGGHNNHSKRGGYNNFGSQKNHYFKNHKKWSAIFAKDNNGPPYNPIIPNDVCRKCREIRHWSRIYRASK